MAAERLLLVEGASDVSILEAWFSASFRDRRTQVLQMRGSDAARSARRYGLLADLGPAFKRSLLFLRDRDELPDSEVRRLEVSNLVKVLPVRELESFFLFEPTAISRVLHSRGALVRPDASIDEELEILATPYASRVVMLRVVSALGPVYPVPWTTIPDSKSGAPSLERLLATIDESRSTLAAAKDLAVSLWAEHELDVQTRWPHHWRELVPAADLLADLWRQSGLAYDKQKDGLQIARLTSPPGWLRDTVGEFVWAPR
jgi:hypothetical protein